MSDLKPCPCCGGTPLVRVHVFSADYSLFYIACKCGIRSDSCESEEEAARLWNSRAADTNRFVPGRRMKYCPFCGSRRVYCGGDAARRYYVCCDGDDCGASTTYFNDRQAALDVWNRRELGL